MGAAATVPHVGGSELVIAHAIIQRVAHSERRSTILSLRRSVVGVAGATLPSCIG
jgi:hypothetical protein